MIAPGPLWRRGRTWPDAAASLREGMAETLMLMRLGITGQLATTPRSPHPCESMIEIVRYTQRNVKRWRDGDVRRRSSNRQSGTATELPRQPGHPHADHAHGRPA